MLGNRKLQLALAVVVALLAATAASLFAQASDPPPSAWSRTRTRTSAVSGSIPQTPYGMLGRGFRNANPRFTVEGPSISLGEPDDKRRPGGRS
jgi:hypothetical protein